jgi:hypothetical protein
MDQKATGVIWEGARLLHELEVAGWTIYRIADHLGRKWDTVNRWRSVEPRFSDAQAVIKLHGEVCSTTKAS